VLHIQQHYDYRRESEEVLMEYAKQRGSASITVDLYDGVITVKSNNNQRREVLIKRTAYDGDWNWIWEALEGNHIPSADPYRAAYYGEETTS